MRSFLLLGALLALRSLHAIEEPAPFGIDQRLSWTNSRLLGSPEPPLSYAVEKTFTHLQWKAPIFVTPEPGSDRLLVVLAGGETDRPSRILSVPNDGDTEEAGTFLVLSNRLIYSVTFHPGYRTNRQLYVFSHGVTGAMARTNRISHFTVERDGPHRCDPESERVILDWNSAGHDGGGLVFGHDGMLYISSGDGSTDSDTRVTGQDLQDLCGGVLRLDVQHPGRTQAYSIPGDNPWVGRTNARPELWAYGLRNPWRLCIDDRTGQIWAGNNGQDLWETAHLVRRGENYGWSVFEGNHPFYLNRQLGPTPVVPPTVEHSHAEFRSLTGGVVYYGDPFPALKGVYIYGDYATGEIWGARHDGTRLKFRRRLAQTQLLITSFAVDQRGALLITDHGGAIFRLVRAPRRRPALPFPTRLSETGLFLSTKDHRVQPALIPYSVNAPGWADGADAQRFMALPDNSRLGRLTNGAVVMQTLSLEREAGRPASAQRIETRLLAFQEGQWFGYSYRWNNHQSDALLVAANGDETEFVIKDPRLPGGKRRQAWRFPSRAECMGCHSRAANFTLGLTDLQLNKVHDYSGVQDHQLRTLQHIGVFTGNLPKPSTARLVDPYDITKDLEARARSYLHVNCAVCHVDAGGGNAKMELGITTSSDRMNVIGARPQHDTFGIDNAMLIHPGDPSRSILYQRLVRQGRGQMPPLCRKVADERAVALFRDWIAGMKPSAPVVRDWKMDDLILALDQLQRGRSFEAGRAAFRETGCSQCHRLAGEGGSVGPDLNGVGRRLSPRELLESLVLPSKVIPENYATTEIETRSGRQLAGRIEGEDDRTLLLRPLDATEEMVTLRKSDIRRRALSAVSNMPTGIVNTLTEGQILDLLAYLIADGKPGEDERK